MSLFCDSSSQLSNKEDTSLQQFTLNTFTAIIQSKNGLKINQNQYVLKFHQLQHQIIDGITSWICSCTQTELSIKVSLELKPLKKALQKRLADTLNKEFKANKLTYFRPKLTSTYKIRLNSRSQSMQHQLNDIIQHLTKIISRIKQLQKGHEKLQPYLELYAMRECFEFNRSSRAKSSKISLKSKKNKIVMEVMIFLTKGEKTLNSLESIFVDGQIKKYEEQKGKILKALEETAKNCDQNLQQSILTSIDIIKIENQKPLSFSNGPKQNQLSILTKGLYTFRKEITIHKESKIQSLSNQVFEQSLIKKCKSLKGADQFDNETRLLTFLKGSFHPHIAEYYCKLEDTPFKSEAVYVRHYESALGGMKSVLSIDKRLEIALQICKVLTYLSYRRICHRDLKLDNIMLDKNLNPRVIDWGSACQMFTLDKDSGGLKVKNQKLFSTEGYFQRYFEEVFHTPFGKNYTQEQIEKGEFFDIYSFGLIVEKLFWESEFEDRCWMDLEMEYLRKKCRQSNPADRLSAIEAEIYLSLVLKKWKKFQKEGLSSPVSSTD